MLNYPEKYCLILFLVPPMLWIPHQLVGAPVAYSVTLECFTEAHPTSLNYWIREDGHMIHESKKYQTENIIGNPVYKTHMRLTINNIQESDYCTYKCIAKNPRGETDGTIRLYSKWKLPGYQVVLQKLSEDCFTFRYYNENLTS